MNISEDCKGIESEQSSSVEMSQVIFKMAGYLSNININRFKKLVIQVFKNKSNALTNIKVKDGCICVSWLTHRSAIPCLITLAQQKVELMRHVGVLKVTQSFWISGIHPSLLHATTADCADAVEFLLTIGADPNCPSENEDTFSSHCCLQ